jgi:hypothetical protein
VLDASAATAGIYGTAPTCYLSYAARLDGFRVSDLDTELYRKRRLLRLRCMRTASYIQPVAALPAVVGATWGGERSDARIMKAGGLSQGGYDKLAARIEEVLAGGRSATATELRELLGSDGPADQQALRYAIRLMAGQARLVRAEVRGGWQSDVYAYARWEDWLGAPTQRMDPEPARAELARRYLAAFGPATKADVKWWTGWTLKETAAALAALGDAVTPVVLTDPKADPAAALVLADELDALAGTDPESARGVRLLPVWDAFLVGYTERRRLLGGGDPGRVYDRFGNATSTVLLDGQAAGVWELDAGAAAKPPGGDMTVRVAPFARQLARRWAEVEQAADRIAAMVQADRMTVERVPQPGRLVEAGKNAFFSPIKNCPRP